MRLLNQAVIITGAASGIGRASALLFAREGARLTLADIDKEGLEETASAIRATGGQVLTVPADVRSEEAINRLVSAAVERYGRLDVMFNCAGVVLVGNAENTAEADWNFVQDVNLKSVFLGSKRAIAEFRRQGGGVILNMASMSGLIANANYAAYNAAKAGVINLTRNLALDYAAHNIRVNCICPGSIDTPMLRKQINTSPDGPEREARVRNINAAIPMGRMGTAEEVASVALFLASDESAYCTGGAFVVDGGYTIR